MKKLFAALLAGTMLCMSLTACGGTTGNGGTTDDGGTTGGGTAHMHTFEEGWTWDETDHWHKATCEHQDEVSEKNAHTMSNGKCSVCGYEEEKKSSLTEDTDFLALVSDRVTEEEWRAVFTDESFANVTMKETKKAGSEMVMKREFTDFGCLMYTESNGQSGVAALTQYMVIEIETQTGKGYTYMDGKWYYTEEPLWIDPHSDKGGFLDLSWIASDFSALYNEFTFDDKLGAYVYDGEGIQVQTTPGEYMGRSMTHAELKFKDGHLASVHWQDSAGDDVYDCYYDYGTTKIVVPEDAKSAAEA